MGISELKKLEASEQKTSERPSALFLNELFVDLDTFQWRVTKYNKIASDEHIRTLVRVLKSTGESFQPLLVYPIGKRFVVIDGHHRLSAYRKARWKKPIPITVFEGSLDKARLAALEANIRDKLPLSKLEKTEAAWKLVNDNKLSKAQIVKLGLASDGTVAVMRKVRKKLVDDGKELSRLSWVEARRSGIEFKSDDAEDWKEKKAQKIVDALLKAKIGQGLAKDPEVTALALWKLNPNLPGALTRQWFMEDPDLKSEIAHELRTEGDPYGLLEEPEEPEKTIEEF
jgi:ParB-like chromosome segregation protein Spo0J